MKYQKIGNWIKVIRQNWKEWFFVDVGEGCVRPRFFLPVSRLYDRRSYRYWVFYLAPFILIGRLIGLAFWTVWNDLVQLVHHLSTLLPTRE